MSNTTVILLDKVRDFLKKIRWKNLLTFSFFVLLAAIFWIMQIYRQKFETTIIVPVKYVNIPDNIIFDNELPDSISVRLKDDGSTLFRYSFRKNDSLMIDINSKITKYGSQIIKGQVFDDLIRNMLYQSSELISYSPSQIECTYETLFHKKVPVEYKAHIDIAPGYIVDGTPAMSTDSIDAYGSEAALDTLYRVSTSSDTIFNYSSTEDVKLKLEELSGIKLKPNFVYIDVPIDEFNQKEIEVPVECINLPASLDIKFFPSQVKIAFYVGLKRSVNIRADMFKVEVDYNQMNINDRALTSTPVSIVKSPEYIKLRSVSPSEVEYVLELK